MVIRPLDLRDLALIARYRNDALTLDTTRAYTRGSPLGARGLLSYINPGRHVYAAVTNGDKTPLVGGVIHTHSDAFAKLLYLAPGTHIDHPLLVDLAEHLTEKAGEWGAFHVNAELDETSEAFPALRRAGFSVYAWQRMWDISKLGDEERQPDNWKRSRSIHFPAIQNLYHQIVPQLLQPIEPLSERARGLVCDTGAMCFVSVTSGTYGTVLTPLIHPEVTDVAKQLAALLTQLPERRNRPVYLLVRSYQAWLEPVLEDLGAQAAPRQAVMVKHLARLVKEGQTVPAVPSGVSVQPSRVSQLELDSKK